MRILLTNDDGVNAPGLKVLERIAGRFSDDIWIVAPTEEQSGAGHSLTLTVPVRLRKLGERRFCVTGTPTDAVMMAIATIMKDDPPDLILSGVNRGANLGEDVTYSGTVSAAMEGALAGIPSIALSQGYAREGMGDTRAVRRGRGLGRAGAAAADRPRRWTSARWSTSTSPPCPPSRSRASASSARASAIMAGCASSSAPIRAAIDYYWFGLGADASNARPRDRPRGDRRRLCRGDAAPPRPHPRAVARPRWRSLYG